MTKLPIRYIAVIFFTLVWCNSALAQKNSRGRFYSAGRYTFV